VKGDAVCISVRTPFAVGRVNCYLLRGEPLTLVDTGPKTPEALADLESGLAAAGAAIEQLELVVLTHQHLDHVGLAHTLKERARCRLAAHELLAEYVNDLNSALAADDAYQSEMLELHGAAPELVAAFRAAREGRRAYADPVRVDLELHEGTSVDAGGRAWRVSHRPGHSPTDTIYLDSEHASAIVGDHLIANISSNPILHRPVGRADADARCRGSSLSAYHGSLRRTAELDLESAYSGHGPVIHDHRALIAGRLADQGRRNEAVAAALEAGPQCAVDIAQSMWGDVARRQAYLTLSEVLGALDVLALEGRVVQDAAGPVIVFSLA
jgi:glyoxylase-like metal-dependent hydrolase (beta-lactamase superfamily II)